MRFVWFWTFWYWSKEGFRTGSLLRGPLHGIGAHWDEWFRHEASEEDRRAIQDAGRTGSTQRQFVIWLRRHWAREAGWERNRVVPRFVLRQLAQFPPFDRWSELKEYGRSCGESGLAAIVLAEDSPGEKEDVRSIDAASLPADPETDRPLIVPEGFQADESELDTAISATLSMLRGKGLLTFVALWILTGLRPYSRSMRMALALGWLAVGGVIIALIAGPEPGDRLLTTVIALVGIWGCLVVISSSLAGKICFDAWRQGKRMSGLLKKSRVRLRMDSGLTLKGGSAGLAFCLNTLHSLYSADPRGARGSWLWLRFFQEMRSSAGSWAATGLVTADSHVKPVVVAPKIRACLQHPAIGHVLTPRQKGTGRRALHRWMESLASSGHPAARPAPITTGARLGYAAESRTLEVHTCSHVAQSIMALGGLRSRWQMVVNLFAIAVTSVMVLALPDVRCILLPPPAPAAVAPSSPSPYFLWVSLETQYPQRFLVVLESEFWSNRRAEVAVHEGAQSVPRAEIRLHRLARPVSPDEEDGTVWVERRQRFLAREFAPGERVGRYSFTYLTHLGHE